jgi:hypothetical protein
MATAKEVLDLFGRALLDEAFRARVFDDPDQAAREVGCELTAEQLAALKAVDLQSIAEALNGSIFDNSGNSSEGGIQ